jgi:hypothetical protein
MLIRVPAPTITQRIHRGEQALTLRQRGATYAEIGHEFGLSKTRVRQIALRAGNPHWQDQLPGRVRTFLHNMNLTALPEIEAAIAVARLSRRELLAAPNIGRGAADAIAAWLAGHGLKLRPESAHAFATRLRREAPPDNDEGASMRGRPPVSTDPLAAGRNKHEATCPYPTRKS